ncbi:hypothetical protein OJ997_36230, partial [Solirubrobacter phytolaccae]
GAAALAGAAAAPASASAVEPLPAGAADTMMPSKATPPPAPPKPPKASKPKSSGGGDRPGWLIPVAIGGAAVVAVIAAIALAGGGGDDPKTVASTPTATPAATEAPTVPVSANGIGLSVPAGWSDGATADIPGFSDSKVTMAGPKGGTIVFGLADETAANPTLLADGLRGDTEPTKEVVDLDGGVQAAKYAALPIGPQTGDVFAVPTDKGIATLACIAEGDTCATIAASMKLEGSKPFPVGPSEKYQTSVEKILGRLDKAEKSAARDLNNAGKRTTQVSATGRLASAYASASRSVRKLNVSPADEGANAQLAAALKSIGADFKKAASEGRAKDRNGFRKAGAAAAGGSKDIESALGGLGDAGYDLSSKTLGRAAAVTKLPTLKKDKVKKQAVPSNSGESTTGSVPETSTDSNSTPPPTNNITPRQTNPTPQNNKPAPKKDNGGGDSLSGGGEG